MKVEKLLFVVETRAGTSRLTERPLTDQERLEGWFDGAEHSWTIYKDKQSNEGHERGRLHSVPKGQILTWRPEPGDRILCTLKVSFSAGVRRAEEVDGGVAEWLVFDGACLDREVVGPGPDNHRRYVFCDSVLGRPVLLGEDGAEDAFGQDELRRALEVALNEDDWRPVQCRYRLEDEPAELKAELEKDFHAAAPALRAFSEINLSRQESVS